MKHRYDPDFDAPRIPMHSGPGISPPAARQNLYDSMGLWIDGIPRLSAWGSICGRGLRYADMGMITDGQKGAIRKISTGRKARGMSSDGIK
jgi:hypothetical protein